MKRSFLRFFRALSAPLRIATLLAATAATSVNAENRSVILEFSLADDELRTPETESAQKPNSKLGILVKQQNGPELFLPVVKDTTLRKDKPADPQTAFPLLVMRTAGDQKCLFQFDVADAKGKTVEKAAFQFLPNWVGRPGTTGRFVFYRMLVDWSEEATWDKAAPGAAASWQGLRKGVDFDATPFASFEQKNLKAGQWLQADGFAAITRGWVDGTFPNYGILACLEGGADQVNLSSHDKLESDFRTAGDLARKSRLIIGGKDRVQPVIHPNLPLLRRALRLSEEEIEDATLQWSIIQTQGDMHGASLSFHRMLRPAGAANALVAGVDYSSEALVSVPLDAIGTGKNTPLVIKGFAPALRKWAGGQWEDYGVLVILNAGPNGPAPELIVVSATGAAELRQRSAKMEVRLNSVTPEHIFTDIVKNRENVYTTVEDGHLDYGGERMRLWGMNLQSRFLIPANVEHTVQRMHDLGFNAIRLWGFAGYSEESAKRGEFMTITQGDGSEADNFDRFVAECKKRNIFIYCTSLQNEIRVRSHPEALFADDSFLADGEDWPQWKQAILEARKTKGDPERFFRYFDERTQKMNRVHMANFLNHRNPYTGKRYAEEETIAMFSLQNENGFLKWVPEKGFASWPAYFRDKLKKRWNAWLRARYRDDQKLVAAWGKLDGGETLAQDGVLMKPLLSERNQYPKARAEDFMRFLVELVTEYNRSAREFCRSQAAPGVGVNVIPFIYDTQFANCLPWLYANSQADIASVGMYSWALTSALTTPPSLNLLDSSTVAQKPMVIYEINAGRPNPFRSEYPMRVAAYTSWQDWDGVFWYNYEFGAKRALTEEQYLIEPIPYMSSDSYWPAAHSERDPVINAAFAAGGQIFKSGAIQPAKNPNVYHVSEKVVCSYEYFNGLAQAMPAFNNGSRIVFEKNQTESMKLEGPNPPSRVTAAVTSGDSLLWDWPNARMIIDTPTVKAYVGKIDGAYHFKDGIVLSGVSTPFVTFAMSRMDGLPLLDAKTPGKIFVSAMFDAKNSGFEFDYSKATFGGGHVSPVDQVRMIKSVGKAPAVVDPVDYTISFPAKLDYRFTEYDFALRDFSQRDIRDSNVLAVANRTPFMGVLEVGKVGAKAEPYIAPSKPSTKSKMEGVEIATAKGIGGDIWNPIPMLRWDHPYALAHQTLRESSFAFSSISPMQDVQSGSIVVSDAEMILSSPANIEVVFKEGQMKRIAATFSRAPNLGEAAGIYKAELGKPIEESIAAQAFAPSKVRWKLEKENVGLEVVMSEVQGVFGITYELSDKGSNGK